MIWPPSANHGHLFLTDRMAMVLIVPAGRCWSTGGFAWPACIARPAAGWKVRAFAAGRDELRPFWVLPAGRATR